jgi:hypothetical protein
MDTVPGRTIGLGAAADWVRSSVPALVPVAIAALNATVAVTGCPPTTSVGDAWNPTIDTGAAGS